MKNEFENFNSIFNDLSKTGLYLFFHDDNYIQIIRNEIDLIANEYWNNTKKLPSKIKSSIEFKLCSHCPEYGKAEICNALKPLLPYLDKIDTYLSCCEVIAVYTDEKKSLIQIAKTTLQNALRYLAILSLIEYCEMHEKYSCYFDSLNPLMSDIEISKIIYSNIFLACKGDKEKVKSNLEAFRSDITASTECLLKRLKMICTNDALINAFVNTQVILQYIGFTELNEKKI